MSDGMTEAFRGARAYEEFDTRFETYVAEYFLLINNGELEEMSIEKLLLRLIELCPDVEVKNYNMFKLPNGNYTSFKSGLDNYPLVKLYSVSSVKGKFFTDEVFKKVLERAVLFADWCNSKAGKEALDDLNCDR